MHNNFQELKYCELFTDILEDDIKKMLICLNAKAKKYDKNSVVILAEDAITSIGIVLSGSVQIIKEDYFGNKNILTELSALEIFAETFVCAGVKKSPVTVISITECEILFVDYSKIITTCSSVCGFHARLIANMLKLIANKNLLLSTKIALISRRTTREKLLSYLAAQADKEQSKCFSIPFSRADLADFLCADRSALSRELCRLRDDGILQFKGNSFELLE